MHKLYDLKDNLCKELERYSDIQTLDANTLNIIDTLAHACKNVCKIIESKEQEMEIMNRGYSGANYPMMYDNYSGRNTHRDSMGRYSRAENGFQMNLQQLMDNAPNEHIRQKLANIMNEV